MRNIAIILLVAFCIALEAIAQSDQRTTEVLAVVKAHDDAWNAKNVKAVGSVIDEKNCSLSGDT